MKTITLIFSCSIAFLTLAQSQLGNGNMEQWDNVGAPTEEPKNWNSFKTGTGPFAGFANKQVERSTSIRAGATGMYCARIWSTSVLGIVANGNLTLGRINLGSSTPANAANYNFSLTSDTLFSETCNLVPDSLVFWAKYTQAGGGNQNARMNALVHDAYQLHDPVDAASQPHILAQAELNYPSTNSAWMRFSVPFVPTANAGLVPAFILATFTTNSTPGGGANNDEVLIDDIQLVYNPSGAGIKENTVPSFSVNYTEGNLYLHGVQEGKLRILSLNGTELFNGWANEKVALQLPSGVFIAQMIREDGKYSVVKFAVN